MTTEYDYKRERQIIAVRESVHRWTLRMTEYADLPIGDFTQAEMAAIVAEADSMTGIASEMIAAGLTELDASQVCGYALEIRYVTIQHCRIIRGLADARAAIRPEDSIMPGVIQAAHVAAVETYIARCRAAETRLPQLAS